MLKNRPGLKRLYKAGKFWVAAAAGALLIAGAARTPQSVAADTDAAPITTTQNTPPDQAATTEPAADQSAAAPASANTTGQSPKAGTFTAAANEPAANDQPAPTSSATVTGPTVTDDSNLNNPLVYSLSGSFKKGDKIQLLIPAGTLNPDNSWVGISPSKRADSSGKWSIQVRSVPKCRCSARRFSENFQV